MQAQRPEASRSKIPLDFPRFFQVASENWSDGSDFCVSFTLSQFLRMLADGKKASYKFVGLLILNLAPNHKNYMARDVIDLLTFRWNSVRGRFDVGTET